MNPRLGMALAIGLALVIFGGRFVRVIPPGHVGVAIFFGSVQDDTYDEGFHVVNPMLSWKVFDVRQKTHKEEAHVPAGCETPITCTAISLHTRTETPGI